MSIEETLLTNLIYNDQFTRKVLPFFKQEYFATPANQIIFTIIKKFLGEYNRCPTKQELRIEAEAKDGIGEKIYEEITNTISSFNKDSVVEDSWIVDKAEEFCKERAIHNALRKAIEIVDDKTGKLTNNSIPEILQDALAVGFDDRVGHDYTEDAAERWDYYHTLEKRVPFDIEYLNKISGGGMAGKRLYLLLMPTGVGKSLTMSHVSAAALAAGYNVLYFTLEMPEEDVAKRIDANLLNMDIGTLVDISKDDYVNKIGKLKSKIKGKLIIKEYPQNSASIAHFDRDINELYLKKKFKPDIIIIDYLGIAASSRLRKSDSNSYEYGKAVAEEFRSLAQKHNVPVLSALQTNRGGLNSSELTMNDVSDSVGGPFTADLLLAGVQPEEFAELNQILWIQLKNRHNDVSDPKKFITGVDKTKMRIYDVEASTQKGFIGADKNADNNDGQKQKKFSDFT